MGPKKDNYGATAIWQQPARRRVPQMEWSLHQLEVTWWVTTQFQKRRPAYSHAWKCDVWGWRSSSAMAGRGGEAQRRVPTHVFREGMNTMLTWDRHDCRVEQAIEETQHQLADSDMTNVSVRVMWAYYQGYAKLTLYSHQPCGFGVLLLSSSSSSKDLYPCKCSLGIRIN